MKTTYVLGRVEFDAIGARWFCEVGGHARRWPIPESVDVGGIHMAEIAASPDGTEPVGPVVNVGPALDARPDATLAEWHALADRGDSLRGLLLGGLWMQGSNNATTQAYGSGYVTAIRDVALRLGVDISPDPTREEISAWGRRDA